MSFIARCDASRAFFKRIEIAVYWGNRNWAPMLDDTLREMGQDGRKRALAFFTSMFSCYSGCRQYRENIGVASEKVGPSAPRVEKVRMGYNHPKFIAAQAELLRQTLLRIAEPMRANTPILFCAHSIPMTMVTTPDIRLN